MANGLLPPGTTWFDEHVKCRKRHLQAEVLRDASERSKQLTGAVSDEERRKVMWMFLEAESQKGLSRGLAAFLRREGMPEEACEVVDGVLDVSDDLNRRAYDTAASIVAANVKTKQESRAKLRKAGAGGGKRNGEKLARQRELLGIEVEGFMMENDGRWPTETEAIKLLGANCENLAIRMPGDTTIKRWLTEMGKPKGGQTT